MKEFFFGNPAVAASQNETEQATLQYLPGGKNSRQLSCRIGSSK